MNTQGTPQSDNSNYAVDEIDLTALLSKLWSRKLFILLMAVVFAGVVVMFHLSQRAFSTASGYELPIMLTFPGVEKGEYPNGDRFIIQDITSSDVLGLVANAIPEFRGNTSSVSIQPGTGLTALVEKQISDKLLDKKLSEEQVLALTTELEKVKGAARQYATITYKEDPRKTPLDASTVETLLLESPKAWSDRAIFEKGVLVKDSQTTSASFSLDGNTTTDVVRQVFRFQEYLAALDSSFRKIESYGIANMNAVSTSKNLKLVDLQVIMSSLKSEFNDLVSMVPSVVNSASSSSSSIGVSALQFKKVNLEHDIERLESLIAMYNRSLESLNNNDGKQVNSGVSNLSNTAANNAYNTAITDQMFNSLLSLGETVSAAELRATIFSKQVETAEKLADKEMELSRLNYNSNELNISIDDLSAIFLSQVNEANSIQLQLNEIAESVSAQMLGTAKVLWEPLGPVKEIRAKTELKTMILHLVLGSVLGAMLGFFIALVVPARKETVSA